ncbi:class I SAM-dependent methyltransferase [Pseudoalteromonas piscicida]|uniref:Class I SAM-dependent methyltransferase n=1 Tax=Pseudoalteromonas piscicida TaxID=43662 RepID=A0AAQ2ETG8_PSEO7|nr:MULTISPECIES: cyclopropane-fatty-acyl-phospholipid synthase family protein [Pseudoalteromonas]TMN35832.1 class I SAM-dependent methyltransferase [Pseudoalteromonas piscicida]TMN40826.1 class I SAM-dependent methyltransferase [Pseudoalteromonas piscicida]TMN50491.1 class I SAM-dependent methyltransferase [Pseudoalteromonas piscicida]TMN58143.1 class I SAM-dependent methyltransferase [Pseudoalteromonas piscicida]TMN59510.1 class I SAM-dependent methyltransferase [Pseudoalteromonas piscicida]
MENTTTISSSISLSTFDRLYKKLVFGALNTLETGKVILVEGDQKYCFGESETSLSVDIHVHSAQMYKLFALGGSVGAGESYILGHWSCSDLTKLIEIFVLNQAQLDAFENKFAFFSGIANKIKHLKNKNSKQGSKRNIVAHYDLGNDLYESFLSEEMLYSSAVYPSKEASLEEAQQHKLAAICERLDLQPTDKVVEIGTGWGAFAVYAAKNYGCHITTTTISEEQHAYVKALIEKEGLQQQITLLKRDYRELDGQYDKLVSIEMIEAVGHAYLSGFFAKCNDLLKPTGAMLIQAITIACQRYQHYLKQSDFIQQYIFPGGCLPSVSEMSKQIVNSTDMVVHELHDIGLHYARTLYDWRVRFEKAWPSLDSKRFDERFYRLWQFYLCYCEGAFKQRATSAVHLVARKPRYQSNVCTQTLDY